MRRNDGEQGAAILDQPAPIGELDVLRRELLQPRPAIEGDAQIEFRLLQKVMYTLDRSGFPDIALAVLKKA